MLKEHPLLLLLGDTKRYSTLLAVAEMRGWTIISATEALDILAMTIVYYPDWVIVDRQLGPEAETAILHLQSVDFAPLFIVDGPTDIIAELDDLLRPVPIR